MEVEFTARQVRISKALREQAEEELQRISRVMGKTAHASVTFSAQKLVQIVELTVQARSQKVVSTGKADSLRTALHEAIEHAENQALRFRDRKLASKRQPKEEKAVAAPPVIRAKSRAAQAKAEAVEEKPVRASAKARKSIAVHSFPTRTTIIEPHVIDSREAIAAHPMTIEEAVKDAESGDRDLLIFHNGTGDTYVLHRRRDGEMELVEIP
jgi:putative sigma-54 modulation protein